MTTDQELLGAALAAATTSAGTDGGPFGAVIVSGDGRVFTGTNRVTATNDPTAHAEVTAIRVAAAALGRFDLSDCTLYTSCAPCPMCLGATLWARIPRIVYAATPEDATAAGFDDAPFYEQLRHGFAPAEITAARIEQVEHPARLAPFEAWAASPSRIEY